jgi:hypothetical protein
MANFSLTLYAIKLTEIAWKFIVPHLVFVILVNVKELQWELPATNTLLFPAAAFCFDMQ